MLTIYEYIKSGSFRSFLPVLLLFLYTAAYADWSTDPATNDITVAHSSSSRYLAPITDGSGGMITAWRDDRNSATTGYDVYMQRLSGDGTEMWASGGIPLVQQTGTQSYPYVLQLTGGGAIIFWTDYRSGNADIYAQKVDVDGNKQWTSSGVAVASGPSTQHYYFDGYWFEDYMILDGSGGAIVAYRDDSDGDKDVYVQRINSSGTKLWGASGVKVTNNANNDQYARIVTDGSGGAIIVWENYVNSSNCTIYGQRVNSSGVAQWTPSDGVNLVPSPPPVGMSAGAPADPEVVPDGAGGAIFLFNNRAGSSLGNLYMQRVDGMGNILWGNSGAVMSNQSSTELWYDIVSDGSGGFYAMWSDLRSGDYDVYAQSIDVDGNKQWTSTGVLIHPGSTTNSQITGDMLVDGDGNLIIAYRDDANSATTGKDIAAQKLDPSGNLLWGNSGSVVCNAANDQYNPRLVPTYVTSSDGYIAVWEDTRAGNYDLYASFVNTDGSLGGAGAQAPLPVDLLSFDGHAVSGQVELTWLTGWELNNDYFDVERSADGLNYTTVGRVAGHGTVDIAREYLFVDQDPRPGINYYRLRQVDFDGAFELSGTIIVDVVRQVDVTMYPNPASDHVLIQSGEYIQSIELRDIMGRLLTASSDVTMQASLDLTPYLPGQYFVVLKTNSAVVTRSLIVR